MRIKWRNTCERDDIHVKAREGGREEGRREEGKTYISNGEDEGKVGQGPVDATKKFLLGGAD
jgi:hypothetical protein